MPPAARPLSPLSLRKRLLFALVLLAALVGSIELISLAAYRLVTGENFSFAALRAQQETRSDSAPRTGPNDEYRATLAPHPYVGFVFDPTKHDGDPGSSRTGHGLLNENGPVHQRAPDRLIVGICGGSVAMDVATLGADTLRAALTEQPAFAGREVVIVRLAVNAYKQPQQLLLLSYLIALGAEFDVLVNVDGFNEATIPHTNVAEGIFPAFPRMWTSLVAEMPDPRRLRMLGRIEHLESTRRQLAGACAGFPLPSVTIGLLWKTADNALRTAAQDTRLQLDALTPDDRPFAITGPQVAFGDESELVDEIIAIWRRCSLQMHHICADHDIRYFHFLQPNQYVAGSKPLSAAELKTAYLEEQPLVHAVRLAYPHLRETGGELRDEGVAFTDLTMMFDQVTETLYRDTCCHLNQRGNDLLARAIAAEIAAVADAIVAARGPGVTVRSLRAAQAEILLTRPAETAELGITAELLNGDTRAVTKDVELRSSAPEVVRVLRRGGIEATGPGSATVTARHRGQSVDIAVTVRYPAVAPFGRGTAGPAGSVPQLRAVLAADRGVLAFELTRAPVDTTGQIVASTRLNRTLWCGGDLYVPLDSPAVIPFTTTARPDGPGGASIELPLRTGMDSGITYWQAMVRCPTASCGWVLTNGVAITVE